MGADQWILAIISVALAPAVLFLSCVIFLAAIGKTFGVRRLYVKILLAVFEWGKQRIERFQKGAGDTGAENHENGDAGHVIEREVSLSGEGIKFSKQRKSVESLGDFQLSDSLYFCKSGMESIIEDGVTERFSAEELDSWNLLTRTNVQYKFISYRLTFLWFTGFVVRYFILFPFRAILALFAIGLLIFSTTIIGYMPSGRVKRLANHMVSTTCYRIMSRAFSAVITFHNKENKAKGGGICVANHTSPIDICILGCDNCYAMVGQAQGGFMGTLQKAMGKATSHIWFQRSEMKDRVAVARKLREHVEDKNKLPILIFPEGTCINNTSIMMFKKGSFEVGGTIYPVAIKYDPRFGDAFWNSSKQNLIQHLIMILTSWALVCDVWYLPPETKQPNEDAVQFANRVKSEIARQGGLVDLEWDGMLKRSQPKPTMKSTLQEEYSKRLKKE